jgi:5-oxoprolinase (ATP-hydrolysing)
MSHVLGVDRGGTFTDVVRRAPDGRLSVSKLLTRQPGGEDATVAALRAHLAAHGPGFEARLGTTVATNALLERRGARVALAITRGFADLLEIGTQERPDLFALRIEKRPPLHAHVLEVDERVLADGTPRRAPDPAAVRAALAEARAAGCDVLAVLLLHSVRWPAHERLVGELARGLGFRHVALSHRVSPQPGAVPRGETAVADGYLTPLLRDYLAGVAAAAGDARAATGATPAASAVGSAPRLLFMQSGGGLCDASAAAGKDALLSGPAGGALAVARVARLCGLRSAIGLDMGGTSTDVCRVADGEPEREFETQVEGLRLRAPALRIHTVAAGGGSRLRLADGRFQVGPDSAGSDPGPACHGRGGPATLTDAHVVLGHVRPEHFPHLALDVAAAHAALAPFGDPARAASGFLEVADEHMAGAIRAVSIARGHDPRGDALVAFGGAGGLHACALAERLGLREVVIHPLAGVLSAWGLLLADRSAHAAAAVAPGEDEPRFPEAEALAELEAQGVARERVELRRLVDARYAGADHVLTIAWGARWRTDFEAAHRRAFGFAHAGRPVEAVTARVQAVAPAAVDDAPPLPERPHEPPPHERGDATRWPAFRRTDLAPGALVRGPAVLFEETATTLVAPGWTCRVDGRLCLRLRREGAPAALAAALRTPGDDPVGLEVMGRRFMAIAAEMGEQLRRTAHSVNIKERLDFSCAVFDAQGGLVANAPHIPVHLGAMGETVRALLAARELRPGDTWVSNDPYAGGSHLPDITVMSPVFRDGRLAFLVANRGHHADVGGPTPGSMPADSRDIAEEGALLSHVLLVRDGAERAGEVTRLLAAAGTRGCPERLADLRAQTAANAHGAAALAALSDELGAAAVAGWMARLADNAEAVMRDVLAGLLGGAPSRRFAFEDGLDDGTRLRVAVDVARGPRGPQAVIDFAGTSPRHAGNRNAPRAVVLAAVLYVFRTLAARPIPLSAGGLRPLELRIPPGCLLDPAPPAAVCGGNVETSQRLVDVLYGALGVQAASQGTMNNLTFGDGSFGYYETLCGGAGAGPGSDGASAVHTHMTNTRLTDVEVLEERFPVVVREFAVRRGSGGAGRWRGGDGVVRAFEFLRPLSVSLLAERRRTRPFGLCGGQPGAPGRDEVGPLGVTIRTPGGGGWGEP